jgi:hypothetical protein
MFGVDFRSYPTSISTIMSHIGLCSCKGIHLSNTCTNSRHTYSSIWHNHKSFSPFPSIRWGWFPPFRWWFPSLDESYFKLGGIYLCLGLFTILFFRWPLRYDVWTFMRLFCPKWFCEWFQLLFRNMWAHYLRSCSTFNFTFVFYILIPSVREVI